MNYETILLTKQGGIATITLSRPEKLNALNPQMIGELAKATRDVAEDKDVRVLVLAGAGRAFCAGGDLSSRIFQITNPVEAWELLQEACKLLLNIRNMPKPVIASVKGAAVGAGCNLAIACDMILAADDAKFGTGFLLVGVHPDTGGTYFLPRLIGTARACELIFTGKIIDAGEAYRIGLVNHVVPADQLEARTRDLATALAKAAPTAIGLAKKSIYQGLGMDLGSALESEARAFSISLVSEDAREGVKAFLEKRPPSFKGQ